MQARVTLRTGGSGAVAHYGVLYETFTLKSAPVFSRMGITLACMTNTVFIPYSNLMQLEWS